MKAQNLTRQQVRKDVPDDHPGFYRLGHVIDGRFYTSYVGRSDSCLQTRLGRHAQLKWFTHFVARPTDTVEEAYRRECLFYHLEEKTTFNKYHPARPAETDLVCPYCEFEERLSVAEAENDQIHNDIA